MCTACGAVGFDKMEPRDLVVKWYGSERRWTGIAMRAGHPVGQGRVGPGMALVADPPNAQRLGAWRMVLDGDKPRECYRAGSGVWLSSGIAFRKPTVRKVYVKRSTRQVNALNRRAGVTR